MRVLVFGASTVEGWWDSEGGWVDRLKRYYNQQQIADWTKKRLRIMNLGVAGQTSEDLLERISNETFARARNYERGIAILISVGSNDAAIKGGIETSLEEFEQRICKILSEAKQLTNKVIFVGLPAVVESKTNPLVDSDHYFKNDRIQLFEDKAAEICKSLNIPFIPIYERFNERMRNGVEVNAMDGLHPNDAGHQLIFELVQPELDKLLNS